MRESGLKFYVKANGTYKIPSLSMRESGLKLNHLLKSIM